MHLLLAQLTRRERDRVTVDAPIASLAAGGARAGA